MYNYYRNKAIAKGADNTADSIQKSGFFEDYGTYIGLPLSAFYIIFSIYYMYSIHNSKNISKKDYILPILFILLGVIDILYFIFNMNSADIKPVNNIVGHISMIPMYMFAIAVCVGVMSNGRGF